MNFELVLSCEHGGHSVPAQYRSLFRGAAKVLASHRGWDAGALTLARDFARVLDAPLHYSTTTRLLVDLNRSAHHPKLYSEWTRSLAREERAEILAKWWTPHRSAVENFVRDHSRRNTNVLHLSVHSFTPHWEGERREVDVGWLYDPSRKGERALATRWIAATKQLAPELCLRRNQPYRGTSDGVTSALRKLFGERRYIGVELEVSQGIALGPAAEWRRVRRALCASLEAALPGAG